MSVAARMFFFAASVEGVLLFWEWFLPFIPTNTTKIIAANHEQTQSGLVVRSEFRFGSLIV